MNLRGLSGLRERLSGGQSADGSLFGILWVVFVTKSLVLIMVAFSFFLAGPGMGSKGAEASALNL